MSAIKLDGNQHIASDLAITAKEFALFRDLITRKTGISLRDSKLEMLSARLVKRLRARSLASFEAYYEYLLFHDKDGEEHRELINCITTNKTSFFREPHHFEFLANLCRGVKVPASKASTVPLSIWSAACSSGEEPYSIAMTLHNALGQTAARAARVLASDIDTQVLQRAELAVYPDESLATVPPGFKERFFLRGSGTQDGLVRVKPEVRESISFRQLNFIQPDWAIRAPFDVIFCRNALIYFEQSTQDAILRRMIRLLKPGGYLIVGHSEHLHWMTDILRLVGTTIYQVKNAL